MKIMFLNPPVSPSQRYGILSQAGAVEPPLGLASLAAITRKNGFASSILDAAALGYGLDDAAEIILKENPDFLGITLTTISLKTSSALANKIKTKTPGMKIIVGGSHITALPEKTLLENAAFDIGVIGEGEKTLEELLRAFVEQTAWDRISGIVFRSNGGIIRTAPRERIKELDELPLPAFDLLPKLARWYRIPTQSLKYMPSVSLVTSRGCPGKCGFCDRAIFGNHVRSHSAEYVAEMMLTLQKNYGIRGVFFEDDNFLLSEERLSDLSRLIKKKNIKIAWSALSRIDIITESRLKFAKQCGCWQILYGIESGSQQILDFYKKDITLENIKSKILLTRKHGFFTKGFFMLGNPLETPATLSQTGDFIKSLGLDDISLTYFTPYPGSEVWDQIEKFGILDTDWDRFSCFDPVFTPKGLSKEQVVATHKSILKSFYSSPKTYRSYLKRIRSWGQIMEFYKSWRAVSSYSKFNTKELTSHGNKAH